jgi:hypothetical protein
MKIELTGDVYVVGDIHGEATLLSHILNLYEIKDCTLILLGDIGIWQYKDYKHYLKLDEYCKTNNIITYAFRGNHDNPAFFLNSEDSSPIARRFWDKFSNFKCLPDLTKLNVNGATGIVIGGGVSIDRCCRKSFQSTYRTYGNLYKRNDWWPNENVPDTSSINDTFDFILSHTGPRPTKCAPLNESNCSFFGKDDTLKDAISTENERLEEIAAQFKPKKWWFGHFHINDSFNYMNIHCTAVDINYLSPLVI